MEVIIKYNSRLFLPGVEQLGQGFGIVDIPEESISELARLPGIEDIESVKRLYTNQSASAFTASCLALAQSPEGFDLDGAGTAVCIIDTGIDYTHPAFRNPDGTTRILFLWDQSAEGEPPAGFRKGTEYTSDMINSALRSGDPFGIVPPLDISGHGTAAAGIAAGSVSSNTEFRGAAPAADIIAVRISSRGDESAVSADIMRALRYTIDRAAEYGLPAAINISYGMNEGSHRGNSLFEEYINALASEWKTVIAVPTGNEGGAGHHYSGRAETGSKEDVFFFTAGGIEYFYLSVWKNFVDEMSFELVLPDGRASPALTGTAPEQSFTAGNISVSALYGQPTRYNADQEVFYYVRAVSGFLPAALWRLRVNAGKITDGRFDIWLPTTEQVSTGTYFSNADNMLSLTIPSTAQKVIRVAGYNDRLSSPAEFSGVGTEGILPDISAPAVSITAPRAGGGYSSVTGTSFAAPFVTGSAALLMQWGIVQGNSPFLYGERIKAYLRRGALRNDTQSYPEPVSGYGRLCTAASLNILVSGL